MSKNKTKSKKGQFKTKTKFIEFIGGKGVVNFLSNEAYIMGNQLSGLEMDGIKFKLTICDDMTVDLEEIDTNHTTKSQRARLLEIIEDKTIAQYRGRTVVQELDFESTTMVKDKYVPLYLAVEVAKPIDRLATLLDPVVDLTEDAMDNLNDLLNSWFEDEEFAKEVQEMIDEENSKVVEDVKGVIDDTFMKHHDTNINTPTDEIEYTTEDPSGLDIYESSKRMNDYMSSLEDSFTNMKEEKLMELKKQRSKKEEELYKLNFQFSTLDKNIEQLKDDLKLLEDRIDDLQPIQSPTGYYFNVSERQNETVVLEPEIEKIIKDKVSKVKAINAEAFMKLFTDGEFHIQLGQKVDDTLTILSDYKTLPEDVLTRFNGLDLQIDESKLIYRGELTWSQVVNKMIKLGFEEDPEFNKMCGSNSYQSNTETKEEIKNRQTTF